MSIRLYNSSLASESDWNAKERSGGGGSRKTLRGKHVSIGCPNKVDNIPRRMKIGETSSMITLLVICRREMCAVLRSQLVFGTDCSTLLPWRQRARASASLPCRNSTQMKRTHVTK